MDKLKIWLKKLIKKSVPYVAVVLTAIIFSYFPLNLPPLDFLNIDGISNISKNLTPRAKYKNGDDIPVSNLMQTAHTNEDFVESEVSWYDDEYNYYVFHIGRIQNVPLTTTYTSFYLNENSVEKTYEESITNVTETSLKTTTSKATRKSTTITGSLGFDLGNSLTEVLSDVLSKTIQKGFSASLSSSKTDETIWTDTYEECIRNSQTEQKIITLTFDSSCEPGNYLYLYLGSMNVYYSIVQSRSNPDKIYTFTHNEIYNHKYALIYTGESDEFPINEKQKIEINTDDITLKTPTNYIESTIDTSQDITFTAYLDESFTVDSSLDVLFADGKWKCPHISIDNMEKYYTAGYNKIEISFSFYEKRNGTTAGIAPTIRGYVSPTTNYDKDAVDYFEMEASKQYKQRNRTVVADLAFFKNSKNIILVFTNENWFDTYQIHSITFNVRIYKE